MSDVLLDAGALVALDKGDRRIAVLLRQLERDRVPRRTSAAVVAQVWRGGASQANLARALRGVKVLGLDEFDARDAGELLGKTATADVVDAHLALLAKPHDQVLTSDPDHIRRLLEARGVKARVTAV